MGRIVDESAFDDYQPAVSEPVPTTPGRVATGGLLNLFNALAAGTGDEVTAGGVARVKQLGRLFSGGEGSYDQDYEDNLALARQLRGEFREQAGPAAIVSDVASGFLLPLGKLKQAGGVLAHALRAGKQGAALGAAYGFGEGEGGAQNRIESALKGGAIGGALGGLVGGASRSLSGAAKTAAHVARDPRRIAAERLAEAGGDDIARIAQSADDPFYKMRTLAEETQNPALAQLQEGVTKTYAPANTRLVENSQARQNLQKELLSGLSEAPALNQEGGGRVVRDVIAGEAKGAKKLAQSLYKELKEIAPNADQGIGTKGIRHLANKQIKETYQAGGVPAQLNVLVKEVNSAVGEKGAQKIPAKRDFEYLVALKRRAQSTWIALRKDPSKQDGARIAANLMRKIDKTIVEAGEKGTLAPEFIDTYKGANKAYSSYKQTYGKGSVGKILATEPGGQFKIDESRVVKSLFDGNPKTTREFLAALPDDKAVIDNVRGAVRDEITLRFSTPDGTLKPNEFRKFLKNNVEAISAKTKDGKAIFEAPHIKTMQQIADDLAFLGGSERSVGKLANRASLGQPTTAQALYMMAKGTLSKIPGAGVAKQLGAALTGYKTDKVNEVLTRAIFDKDFAKELLKTATPGRLEALLSRADTQAAAVQNLSRRLMPTVEISRSQLNRESQQPTERERLQRPSLNSTSQQSAGRPPGAGTANKSRRGRIVSESEFDPLPNSAAKSSLKQDVKYDGDVKQLTSKLSPFIQAVIQVESAGNPNARSSAGARGLMQVMPEHYKRLNITNPEDPRQSIRAGTQILQEELERFGDTKLALAAYNAGSPKVIKAISKAGSDDFNRVYPYLPKETQAYVAKVLTQFQRLSTQGV